MIDGNCGDCRFWDLVPSIQRRDELRIGKCRRRAPKLVFKEADQSSHASFPLVAEDGWCGDFRKPRAERDLAE